MTTEELANKIVGILESKKGSDIEVIDVADKTTLADFFIIATGNDKWILIDFKDIIVHIMHPEVRASYDLESLWEKK